METVARPPSCPLPTRFAGTEARPHSCFRAAGVRLIREMPQGDLHAALKNCFAVVNSSVSEGMSAAILEVGTSPSPGTGACRGPLLPALLGGGGVLVSRGPHFSQLQGAKQHSLGFSEAGFKFYAISCLLAVCPCQLQNKTKPAGLSEPLNLCDGKALTCKRLGRELGLGWGGGYCGTKPSVS